MDKIIKYLIALSCAVALLFNSVSVNSTPAVKNVRWAFIMNFIPYISWPDIHKGDEISVCIVGKNPFNHVTDSFKSKSKTGVVTVAKLYESIPEVSVLSQCQVIYFSQSVSLGQLSYLFTQLKKDSILTIGDHGAFVKLGGILQFKQRGKKLRFSLNKALLSEVEFKVHPALLRLSL